MHPLQPFVRMRYEGAWYLTNSDKSWTFREKDSEIPTCWSNWHVSKIWTLQVLLWENSIESNKNETHQRKCIWHWKVLIHKVYHAWQGQQGKFQAHTGTGLHSENTLKVPSNRAVVWSTSARSLTAIMHIIRLKSAEVLPMLDRGGRLDWTPSEDCTIFHIRHDASKAASRASRTPFFAPEQFKQDRLLSTGYFRAFLWTTNQATLCNGVQLLQFTIYFSYSLFERSRSLPDWLLKNRDNDQRKFR